MREGSHGRPNKFSFTSSFTESLQLFFTWPFLEQSPDAAHFIIQARRTMLGHWHNLNLPPVSTLGAWVTIVIGALAAVAISFWIAERLEHR